MTDTIERPEKPKRIKAPKVDDQPETYTEAGPPPVVGEVDFRIGDRVSFWDEGIDGDLVEFGADVVAPSRAHPGTYIVNILYPGPPIWNGPAGRDNISGSKEPRLGAITRRE